MADHQPRKLRLLFKGKEKFGDFLHRRKKAKKDKDDLQAGYEDNEDDFEDDVPILSRINDPSKVAASKIVTLRANSRFLEGLKSSLKRSESRDAQSEGEAKDDDRKKNGDTTMTDVKVMKARRRRGVTGMQELQDRSRRALTFNTNTVIAKKRAIATQPSAPAPSHIFTFKVKNGLDRFPASDEAALRSEANAREPSQSQVQQAARNAFLKSIPEPQHVPVERFQSMQPGVDVQSIQDDRKSSSSGRIKSKAPKLLDLQRPGPFDFLSKPMQTPTTNDPLSYLRLSSVSSAQPPIIDKATLVTKPSDYVRPKIETPLPGPEIYRDGRHKSVMPKHVFAHSIPDGVESAGFIYDAGKDKEAPRRTSDGDIPAATLVRGERVPIGARLKLKTAAQLMIEEQRKAFTKNTTELYAPTRTGVTNLPFHATTRSRLQRTSVHSLKALEVSETHYTAPGRLPSALSHARTHLTSIRTCGIKRKRDNATLLPHSYQYYHTGSPTFNIFTNGILNYPELTLLFASHLPVRTLINLYSISRDFHVIINQRFTTVILNQLRVKAPCAPKCYPWRCYAHLCQPDPSLAAQGQPLGASGVTINIPRNGPPSPSESPFKPTAPATFAVLSNHSSSMAAGIGGQVRKVPTFRYLHMAIHREKVIHELYALFAEQGVPLPGCPATYFPNPHEHASLTNNKGFATTLHKIWFLFDIPDNPRRIGYIHSPLLFTNADILYALTFVVKLDMLLNDPLGGEKRDAMRKLLFSSCDGFDTILRVLNRDPIPGRGWNNELDLLRAWTRYGLQVGEDGTERAIGGGFVPFGLSEEERKTSKSVFGIPREEVGLLKREFWGALDMYQRPDKKGKKKTVVGRQPSYLMRVDQLVLRESIKRGMVMSKQFLRSLLHGYVDQDTLERIPVREYGRRSEVLETEGEYDVDGVVGGLGALKISEGGDELLDLGECQSERGSVLMSKRRGVSEREIRARKQEEVVKKDMYTAWKAEVEREKQAEKLRREVGQQYLMDAM
ncbi:hypothetical protein H2198_006176 [Neophaeococcomyces mojaviensis]|uniref:Uncharacterized protein n=1 Tax=Neophaeococcomyces mojaviensis TaxID=3383035 RepID=A0ACC3A3M0_9EURO|nr:hypothetical protein H2198_006176 [Knufia sp. JES_112]